MEGPQLVAGMDIDHSFPNTYQLTTPINASQAYRFGFKPKNVTAVCLPQPRRSTGGIFLYHSPWVATNPVYLFQLAFASILTHGCISILKPFRQATIVGQMMGGIIAGPSVIGLIGSFADTVFPISMIQHLETVSSFGLMFFLFILGVKMDYGMIKSSGSRAWLIGISTYLLPMLLTPSVSSILKTYIKMEAGLETSVNFLAVLMSSTAFHSVASFLEDLKLLNSELGRLAMSSSMISGGLSYTTLLLAFSARQSQLNGSGIGAWLCVVASAIAQIVFTKVAIKPILVRMNKKAPHGQPIKESHHCMVLVLVLGSALMSEIMGLHSFFGPMVLGLEVPDGSPLAFTLVEKLEFFVSFAMLPTYFVVCGGRTHLGRVSPVTFLVVLLMYLSGFLCKFIATVLPCFFVCGMLLRDAVTLSLILNTIGILDIQFYTRANQLRYIDNHCFSVLNTAAVFITGIVSHLVSTLYDPSSRYTTYKRRTIQHSLRHVELRLLVCVHQEEQVPNIINLLEVSNPTRESPIAVFLLHLIQLAGRATPLLVAHQPYNHFRHRPSNPIINAFRMYERNNLSIVTLQPFTAMAPYATMHDDICTLALDNRASLIVLPFHKQWNSTSSTAANHHHHATDSSRFRSVNLKVLDKAPCSVGILVDRGSWQGTRSVLGTWSLFRVGMFFVGGADDREALAYGMRMSEHPNVSVTLVRFLLLEETICMDENDNRRMDNDMVNEFKACKVGSEKGVYREEVAVDSLSVCSAIRSMDHSFDLVVVGRRHEENSRLASGLKDWIDFPELGFLGDMLASEDAAGRTSVLVIQQHIGADGEALVFTYPDQFTPIHQDDSSSLPPPPPPIVSFKYR